MHRVNEMSGKHRWLRISLRSLLVATLIIAVGLAWFTNYANSRRSAFAAIRQAGGQIQMANVPKTALAARLESWFGPELIGDAYKVDLRKTKANNDLLKQIAVLRELRALDLSYASVDDTGLLTIAHLPLQELWLQSTNITDLSAATISGFRSLEFLAINATSLTDHFLEEVQSLPVLKNLGLRGSKVTGAGMQFLSRHPKIEKLDVYSTEVDDAGVESLTSSKSITDLGLSMTKVPNQVFVHLDRLPNLSRADLSGNSLVSTEMVLAFEKSHPKCDIEWYGQ